MKKYFFLASGLVIRRMHQSPLCNGFNWGAYGVSPNRHAGRVAYTTRIIWNKTWSTSASYELEGRENALYQNVNWGTSVSF